LLGQKFWGSVLNRSQLQKQDPAEILGKQNSRTIRGQPKRGRKRIPGYWKSTLTRTSYSVEKGKTGGANAPRKRVDPPGAIEQGNLKHTQLMDEEKIRRSL